MVLAVARHNFPGINRELNLLYSGFCEITQLFKTIIICCLKKTKNNVILSDQKFKVYD